MHSVDEQLRVLTHAAVDVHPAGELERRIADVVAGRRPGLRVKFGVDPTSPDLHLGHSVVFRRLADFQRMGHTAVLIIGGFTARVGDPSGRSATRPRLTAEEVGRHARTYVEQAGRILLDAPLEIVDNAEWLAPLRMADVLELTASTTVARMLERADFAARFAEQRPIAVSEFLYPLLQGRDSVAVRADVELGGTDQLFNLLMGRQLQTQAGQEPQCVLTMPLLEGLDGSAKMSKTAGNTIGVDEPPGEMFGKAMSLRDELTVKYLRLVTDTHPDEVDRMERALGDRTLHPAEAKRRLARAIVELYHGSEAARDAERRFDRQFREHAAPDDAPTVRVGGTDPWFLPTLLQTAGLVTSGGEARRMVRQGAVRLDGTSLSDETAEIPTADLVGRVLQVGKRRFARLVP